MAKTVKDTYGEILKLRNEFYQKWQDSPQYDENRDAYRAKYEAFDKALELLIPSIVDPQPEDSGELTLSVTKMSDQEEPVSEDFKQFEDEYLDKEKDEILCIYDRHAGLVDGANWQRERDAKYKADNNICCMNFDDIEAARIGAYEQGKSDMKQQMMNTAIDGYIDQIEYPGSTFIQLSENPKDFNNGEDVKVIIIKNKEG